MSRISFAQIPTPERRRGPLGEGLTLYAEAVVQVYESEGTPALEEYVNRSLKESGTEIFLFDAGGKPLTASGSGSSCNVAAEIQATHQRLFPLLPAPGQVTWGRVWFRPAEAIYFYCPFPPARRVRRLLTAPRIAVSILIAGVVCYLLALYLTSPVKKLKSVVQSFAEGNLEARVAPQLGSRHDELADLGREFDHMAERIAALISSQKRLLADISHELRSPLARLTVALALARKNTTTKGRISAGQD